MHYSKEIKNGLLYLRFSGDLIFEEKGSELVKIVNEAISSGVTHCLLNIEDLKYINSSGVGVIITLLTKFRNNNGELYVIKPSDHVTKLLAMTKLDAIFTIANSEEEAIKKYNL